MSFVIVAFTAASGICQTQQSKEQPKEAPVVDDFWIKEIGQHVCADAACFASAPPAGMNPWGVVLTRMLASKTNVGLSKWQFEFTETLPLNRDHLDITNDGRRLPVILYKNIKELGADYGFYRIFNEAIEKSYFANQEQFVNSAEENKDRVYPDLKATPDRFRGQIITVKGTLKVIRKNDTPRLVANRLGKEIPWIYTGWIFGPTKGAPAFAVVFQELPVEASVSEKLDLDVTFHGYFLGLVSFPPDKEARGKTRDVPHPYLVGKTLTVHPREKKDEVVPPEEKDATPQSYYILAWTVGGIVAVAFMVAILNTWFRSGDRRIQSRLADMRERAQPFNLEPADEAAPPDKAEDAKPTEPPPL